ncbi:MAG: CCA tRNA nucleotidyltransferase [Phycisphaeraceae bacterium]
MSLFETSLRRAAVEVVQTLRQAGHVAYFAGGCVRDALLGHPPKDYDVATDALPEKVISLFRRARFVGEAFGVVLVNMLGDLMSEDEQRDEPDAPRTRQHRRIHQIEVATFRTEWGYEDGRRPKNVEFTDAENDARRRDFTVNGLFEDPIADDGEARIIDYIGGRADLHAHILRAIGDAQTRFGEDYLRMLRAVRFAARLGFRLDPATAKAIRKRAAKLSMISRERIGQEVEAMFTGPAALRAVRLVQRLELDGPVLEEPAASPPLRTVAGLSRLKRSEAIAFPAMLAGWMIDRHLSPHLPIVDLLQSFLDETGSEIVPRWRRALCLPNHHRDALRQSLSLLPATMNWSELTKAKRKRLLAHACWPHAWAVTRAMGWSPAVVPIIRMIAAESQPLLAEGVAPEPLVNGDDLIRLGVKPGRGFGRALDAVYDEQLEGRITTRQEADAFVRSRSWAK